LERRKQTDRNLGPPTTKPVAASVAPKATAPRPPAPAPAFSYCGAPS